MGHRDVLHVVLAFAAFGLLTVPGAWAGSHDGTYAIRVTFKGPAGSESHEFPNAFRVSGSSIDGTYDGSVTGSSVTMRGPCPQNPGTATFTGTFTSDGAASGQYDCVNPGSGTWSARRTSAATGGGGGVDPTGLLVAVGVAAAVAVVAAAAAASAKKRRAQVPAPGPTGPAPGADPPGWQVVRGAPAAPSGPRFGGVGSYAWSSPEPAPAQVGPAASAIEAGGRLVPGHWVEVGPGAPRPPVEELTVRRVDGRARLEWREPTLDPRHGERILGHALYELRFTPEGTAPQARFVGALPPGATQSELPFAQTHRWNTAGDLAGYRVETWYESGPADALESHVGGSRFVPAPR